MNNEQNKVTFAEGVFAKKPHEKAPDFIKANISIKKDEFFNWCKTHEGNWVNLDIKESKGGKWYAQVNDWKPEEKQSLAPEWEDKPANQHPDDDADPSQIPF